tara:strand:+ start:1470 stop:1586 length:117 start_codon:yes stop_codon:yes gene_type:complete
MFYIDVVEWIDKETLKLINRKLKIQKELLEIDKELGID